MARTIALLFFLIACPALVQGRDFLNEQEADRVREAQEIDKRASVFLRIAERRLNALLGAAATSAPPSAQKEKKKKDKDKEKEDEGDYGPEPTGTVEELLENYAGVMSELLDKLDDAFERKKGDPNLPKAIDKILDVGETHLQRLAQLRAKVKSEAEQSALEKAMEIAKMAVDGAREFKTQK